MDLLGRLCLCAVIASAMLDGINLAVGGKENREVAYGVIVLFCVVVSITWLIQQDKENGR